MPETIESLGFLCMKEIWKDIPSYNEMYQVSNLGNVKSLDRYVNGNGGSIYLRKGSLMNTVYDNKRYMQLNLSKNGSSRCFKVHQLVAMAFLGHIDINRFIVVDHIDNNPLNNNLNNLQIITARLNSSKDKKKSSRYIGVHWNIEKNKWDATIRIKNKKKYIGRFNNEEDASKAYQKVLNEI